MQSRAICLRRVAAIMLACSLTASGFAQVTRKPARATPSAASDASARATLAQMVDALKQTPADTDLRTRIIKLAAGMKTPPGIPEEARRYFVKAVAIQRTPKRRRRLHWPLPPMSRLWGWPRGGPTPTTT